MPFSKNNKVNRLHLLAAIKYYFPLFIKYNKYVRSQSLSGEPNIIDNKIRGQVSNKDIFNQKGGKTQSLWFTELFDYLHTVHFSEVLDNLPRLEQIASIIWEFVNWKITIALENFQCDLVIWNQNRRQDEPLYEDQIIIVVNMENLSLERVMVPNLHLHTDNPEEFLSYLSHIIREALEKMIPFKSPN